MIEFPRRLHVLYDILKLSIAKIHAHIFCYIDASRLNTCRSTESYIEGVSTNDHFYLLMVTKASFYKS